MPIEKNGTVNDIGCEIKSEQDGLQSCWEGSKTYGTAQPNLPVVLDFSHWCPQNMPLYKGYSRVGWCCPVFQSLSSICVQKQYMTNFDQDQVLNAGKNQDEQKKGD